MTNGSGDGVDLAALGRTELEGLLDPSYEPSVPFDQPIHRAAVAAIFRAGATATELLLIQRAQRLGDPWSGQMAFPGGRTDPDDPTPEYTAVRETREEIGLELGTDHAIGTLAELDGGRATNRLVLVSAHAYWLDGSTPMLSPNHEVADTVWVPLPHLADPGRHVDYFYPPAGANFPGVRIDGTDQILWGLTLRFVGHLFERLRVPFLV